MGVYRKKEADNSEIIRNRKILINTSFNFASEAIQFPLYLYYYFSNVCCTFFIIKIEL